MKRYLPIGLKILFSSGTDFSDLEKSMAHIQGHMIIEKIRRLPLSPSDKLDLLRDIEKEFSPDIK